MLTLIVRACRRIGYRRSASSIKCHVVAALRSVGTASPSLAVHVDRARAAQPQSATRDGAERSGLFWVARIRVQQRLQAQNVDQRQECRRLLLPAWVVEEESRKGLAPLFKDSHERSAREIRCSRMERREKDVTGPSKRFARVMSSGLCPVKSTGTAPLRRPE